MSEFLKVGGGGKGDPAPPVGPIPAVPPFPASHASSCYAPTTPFSPQLLPHMPDKCVCGADAAVPKGQLGDALQCPAVAMYPQCPTICTTCFHLIVKSALPAADRTESLRAPDVAGSPPTVAPAPSNQNNMFLLSQVVGY